MNDQHLRPSLLYRMVAFFLWVLFAVSIAAIAWYYPSAPSWQYEDLFRISSLSLIIWATVSFFSAVVLSFAGKYLIGFAYYNRFVYLALGFTTSVSLLVFANHVLLILLAWLGMGFFMARLIGIDRRWGEAKEAARYCQRHFAAGTIFLALGLLLLCFQLHEFTLTGLMAGVDRLPFWVLLVSALCITVAAAIQSAYWSHRASTGCLGPTRATSPRPWSNALAWAVAIGRDCRISPRVHRAARGFEGLPRCACVSRGTRKA